MGNKTKTPRYVKTLVPYADAHIEIYAGVKVSSALKEFLKLGLYQGAKISDLFGAIYAQGKKDGAKLVRDSFEKMMIDIPHQKPGRPKRKRKKNG